MTTAQKHSFIFRGNQYTDIPLKRTCSLIGIAPSTLKLLSADGMGIQDIIDDRAEPTFKEKLDAVIQARDDAEELLRLERADAKKRRDERFARADIRKRTGYVYNYNDSLGGL